MNKNLLNVCINTLCAQHRLLLTRLQSTLIVWFWSLNLVDLKVTILTEFVQEVKWRQIMHSRHCCLESVFAFCPSISVMDTFPSCWERTHRFYLKCNLRCHIICKLKLTSIVLLIHMLNVKIAVIYFVQIYWVYYCNKTISELWAINWLSSHLTACWHWLIHHVIQSNVNMNVN